MRQITTLFRMCDVNHDGVVSMVEYIRGAKKFEALKKELGETGELSSSAHSFYESLRVSPDLTLIKKLPLGQATLEAVLQGAKHENNGCTALMALPEEEEPGDDAVLQYLKKREFFAGVAKLSPEKGEPYTIHFLAPGAWAQAQLHPHPNINPNP